MIYNWRCLRLDEIEFAKLFVSLFIVSHFPWECKLHETGTVSLSLLFYCFFSPTVSRTLLSHNGYLISRYLMKESGLSLWCPWPGFPLVAVWLHCDGLSVCSARSSWSHDPFPQRGLGHYQPWLLFHAHHTCHWCFTHTHMDSRTTQCCLPSGHMPRTPVPQGTGTSHWVHLQMKGGGKRCPVVCWLKFKNQISPQDRALMCSICQFLWWKCSPSWPISGYCHEVNQLAKLLDNLTAHFHKPVQASSDPPLEPRLAS